MAKKKKNAPEVAENASESALIKTRSCTILVCINLENEKMHAIIEDHVNGKIYDAEAVLEVR